MRRRGTARRERDEAVAARQELRAQNDLLAQQLDRALGQTLASATAAAAYASSPASSLAGTPGTPAAAAAGDELRALREQVPQLLVYYPPAIDCWRIIY